MNPMKRLAVAVLLVVGVTLLASTPARAGELMNTGDEPLATGQVTYGDQVKFGGYDPFGNPYWVHKVTITCQNLTPRATYVTSVGSFTANRAGEGKAAGWSNVLGPYVYVDRLNPDGSWTPVLWGY